MTPDTDAQLVAACRTGGREAFGAIVDRYRGLVSAVAYDGCRGDLARSEDVAQEAFLVAWQQLPSLANPSRLAAWLCGIARNVARATNRRSQRENRPLPLDPFHAASEAANPARVALAREQQALLWSTLEAIPDPYRQVVILYYRQQQSVAEVAAALQLSEPAVRKRLERGRAMLRKELARFVEDALAGTTPDPAFTATVLAVLPVLSMPTLAASATTGVFAKSTGLLASLLWLAGPLLGLCGGIAGTVVGIRGTRTPRERRLIVRFSVQLWIVIIAFILLAAATMLWGRRVLSPSGFIATIVAEWGIYFVAIVAWVLVVERRRGRILREDGVADTANDPSRVRPGAVTLCLAIFGSIAWMIGWALSAGDIAGAVAVAAAAGLLCAWAIHRARRSRGHDRQTLLVLITAITVVTAVVSNLRIENWMAHAPAAPPGFPLWGFNALLLVLWLGMTAQVLATTRQRPADANGGQ